MKSFRIFVKEIVCGMLILAVFILFNPPFIFSQDISDLKIDSVSYNSENRVESSVYKSSRNIFQHTIALPSYLLHWSVWPLGKGLQFSEKKFPNLFRGERGKVAIVPQFETGGEAGTALGAIIFHRDLFGTGHEVRGDFLIASSNFNDFDFEYKIPNLISHNDNIEFEGEYFNDPSEALFSGNNQPADEESTFRIEEANGEVKYYLPFGTRSHFEYGTKYRNITIRQSKFRASEDFFNPLPDPLKGKTELLETRTAFYFDFAKGTQRTYLGPKFFIELKLGQSLDTNRFSYIDYIVEWQHFLPLGFLPNTRRFAFRTQLQRVEPFKGKDIPFFELPSLGADDDLRGFTGDRFRDDGLLLFTLEYRYPMWDFMDVVIFVDEGQVFDRYSDIAFNEFHTDYGFGFHLLNSTGVAVRFEMAFSKRTSRTILTISPNF